MTIEQDVQALTVQVTDLVDEVSGLAVTNADLLVAINIKKATIEAAANASEGAAASAATATAAAATATAIVGAAQQTLDDAEDAIIVVNTALGTINQSVTTASGHAGTASTAATTALGYRDAAYTYSQSALGYRDAALGYRDTAAGHATTATNAIATTLGYRDAAAGHVTTALGHANAALGYRNTANEWATKMGSAVAGGEFSSKYHADAAAASAAAAALSAQQSSSGQINADWNVTDPLQKSFIINKPVIPATKGDIGLGNVDNTSDANKPVSAAQAAALAPKASPTLTGLTSVGTLVTTGGIGLGGSVSSSQTLRIAKSITGGTVAMGAQNDGVIQSDVTAIAVGYNTNLTTTAAAFTLSNLYHFLSGQSALGAGSAVTNQYGYAATSNLTGATNNYGFYGDLSAAAGRWNLYMPGTAKNYMAGNVLIGSATDNGDKLQVTGNTTFTGYVGVGFAGAANLSLSINRAISGSTTAYGVRQSGIVQSAVTTEVMSFGSFSHTVASAFNLDYFHHYYAGQGTIGAGSTIGTQSGLYVGASMTGAGTNCGVNLNLAANTNVWNIYAPGTALNYVAGKMLLGVGVGNSGEQLQVMGNTKLTGTFALSGAATFSGAVTFSSTVTGLTKTTVGLANVDNTTDAAKPVSALTQTALDAKLNLAGGVMTGPVTELTGAMPALAIAAANGAVQTKTIAANSTFTESLTAGQSVVLMLTGGSSYAVTWPTVNWISLTGNTAPTLAAKSAILFFKVGTTLYGSYLGSFV